MCGIAGFIDNSSRPDMNQILKRMTEALAHRGPDDHGAELFNAGDFKIGFVLRRLSIIDLAQSGHQPMWDESKDICIVYNGEIYNYGEIKEELKKSGYHFRSNSDTEVILYSFKRWGMDCVKKFIGMFAFVIYFERENKVFFCRDRLGVKPLYYYSHGNLLLFASEIKSFHHHPDFVKEIDKNGFTKYVELGYLPYSSSIYKNVRKVLPGMWMIYDLKTKAIYENRYWDIKTITSSSRQDLSQKQVLEELKSIIISAFRYRLVSDVPVGVFLSGGIDSSLLSSVLSRECEAQITTMTVGFNEKDYNEAPFAKNVASILRTDHIEEYCHASDAFKLFTEISEVYDEPFGDSSAIPTLLLSKMASKYRKVVLSADGGDELFAGYPSYQLVNRYFKLFLKIPIKKRKEIIWVIRKVISSPKPGRYNSLFSVIYDIAESDSIHSLNSSINNPFSRSELINLFNFKYSPEEPSESLNNIDDIIFSLKNFDLNQYLIDDILVKVDRATMHSSIESREPFLDHRLVEFAARLPSSLHLNKINQKILLKEMLSDYLPKNAYERPKRGFEIPIKAWMSGELKDYYEFYLSKEQVSQSGLLNYSQVKYYKDLFNNNINIRGLNRKLWHLLIFQVWYEKWNKLTR